MLLMRNHWRDAVIVASTAAVIAALSLAVRPTAAQAPAQAPAPRTADGKPNLSGIWQTLNTANWDLQTHAARPSLAVVRGPEGDVPAAAGLALGAIGGVPGGIGVVEGNEIPYLPAAAAKKKENFENVLARDPEVKCFLPGVPRVMYMPYPVQIFQGPNRIMMVGEYATTNRIIHMDKVEPPPVETWMGHSVGRWEGDTLVVDTTGQPEPTWLDRSGNFHSDALRVVERYTPLTPYHLTYEVTIEDPKVFTRPWKMSMPLYRRMEPNIQLMEYKCVQFVEELMYGQLRKEPLVRHWEEDLGDHGGRIGVDVTRRRVE